VCSLARILYTQRKKGISKKYVKEQKNAYYEYMIWMKTPPPDYAYYEYIIWMKPHP
jgi:hypothetical protein